jgi:hypothetical protein
VKSESAVAISLELKSVDQQHYCCRYNKVILESGIRDNMSTQCTDAVTYMYNIRDQKCTQCYFALMSTTRLEITSAESDILSKCQS